MEWLLAHAAELGALVSIVGGAWALLARIDKSYKDHLRDEFATKHDFRRLEEKVDGALMLAFGQTRRRKRKAKANS